MAPRQPRPFGPGVIWPLTLVATTTSSRATSLFNSRPVATSLAPLEYTSAVSKKVMPPSSARRTNGSVASSSRTHGRSEPLP